MLEALRIYFFEILLILKNIDGGLGIYLLLRFLFWSPQFLWLQLLRHVLEATEVDCREQMIGDLRMHREQ